MRTSVDASVGRGLAVCGLVGLLLCAFWPRQRARPPAAVNLNLAPVPGSRTFDGALRAAAAWRMMAREAVLAKLEAIEADDTGGLGGAATELLRRQLMAADADGYLREARAAAHGAAAQARTGQQKYRLAKLMVLIECDAGNHGKELREAQRLVALRPYSRTALRILLHAATCSGQARVRRRAAAALRVRDD